MNDVLECNKQTAQAFYDLMFKPRDSTLSCTVSRNGQATVPGRALTSFGSTERAESSSMRMCFSASPRNQQTATRCFKIRRKGCSI